jgi:cytosine permease
MTLALWTTGDTNLYLPSVQTAALFRRPKRVTVVICGLLGTVLGLGIYQYFLGWIDLLATIVPPIIGPVIAEYYLFRGRPRELPVDEHAPLNVSAVLALLGGALLAAAGSRAGASFAIPVAPALVGLVASIVIYALARTFELRLRRRPVPAT